jgi:hypothetical protein
VKAPRTLAIALSIGLALAIALLSPNASAQKVDAAAKALQKKAMDEDYLATEFAKAQDKLDKALAQCGTDKCSPQTRALLRRDLGVVQIGGQLDRAKGVQNFIEAIKLDGSVQLDPDLKTKDLETAWAEAKKKAGAGGTPAPAGGGAAPAGGGDQPQGDFQHAPVAEQQIRTPIPIYVEYAGEEQIVKVIARYKGFGMTEWKTVELAKLGTGWGATLPCADVQQGTTLYYLQGFNAANDPVVTGGDRNHPYKVPVKREAVAEPPHLPNQAAPKQCADTGDCPPNFPGCKKPGAGAGAGPTVKEEVVGKDGGEYCEEDSECRSAKCDGNKCTEPEGAKGFKRFWVGVSGTFDYAFVASANDVCKLSAPRDNQLPLNDANYYCTLSDGADYPYRLTGPNDTNPRGPENASLVAGQSNKVDGGGAFGNIRLMASIDYAVNVNILVGARLGLVLNTYNGQAAKDDGKTFPPVHVEARGTYLFGKDALLQKLAPYAMLAAGVSTWDAAVDVSVVEQAPGQTTRRAKDVTAWQIGGPTFVALGGGARIAISKSGALMAGLRLNLPFGNAFLPSVGPEVGLNFGF